MKNWVKLAVLVVAAVVVTQLLVQRSAPRMAPGEAAPPLVLKDLQGRSVDLASLRGKAVAVNFWATWCGPCQMEMPELAQLWQERKDRCFELLGVAEESARDDVARAATTIPYPILLDERAQVASAWKVLGYPHTYLVSPEGKVVRVFRGAVNKAELDDALRPIVPASCR